MCNIFVSCRFIVLLAFLYLRECQCQKLREWNVSSPNGLYLYVIKALLGITRRFIQLIFLIFFHEDTDPPYSSGLCVCLLLETWCVTLFLWGVITTTREWANEHSYPNGKC